MLKYKILGTVNIVLSLIFIFILTSSAYNKDTLSSLESIIRAHLPNLIVFFLVLCNTFIAYKLFFKKENRQSFILYFVFTSSTIFWFLMMLIGYFFASDIIFPIASTIVTIIIFYFLRITSKKAATIFTSVTLIILLITIISSFEEDYCWKKGNGIDSIGSKMVIATKKDAELLKEFGVREGALIGAHFRAHILCHDSFTFSKALKEKYLFQR